MELKWRIQQSKGIQSRSRTDGYSVTGPGSLNAIFLRNQKSEANNVDVLHTLSEMTMVRSKIWMTRDKTKTNASWDNMATIAWPASGKKTSDIVRLSQPTLGFFLPAFCFSLSRQQTAC